MSVRTVYMNVILLNRTYSANLKADVTGETGQ
jgi:hypothetical protein